MDKERAESSKKYRYTKQLVRIAIENGYTNADIAVKAGLSKTSISMVSRWRNGESLATERQMRSLINEFGHHLKRRMEHLLCFIDDENGEQKFFHLEGDILLKHTIRIPVNTGKFEKTVNIGTHRIMMIENENKLIVLFQSRVGLQEKLKAENIKNLAHSDNEEANWLTYSIGSSSDPLTVIDLMSKHIKSIKIYQTSTFLSDIQQNEHLILAYKARQTLLRHGYTINDLIKIDLSLCEIQDKVTQ